MLGFTSNFILLLSIAAQLLLLLVICSMLFRCTALLQNFDQDIFGTSCAANIAGGKGEL